MSQGSHLFRDGNVGKFEKVQRFAEMTSLLGVPPEEFLNRSKECSEFWDANGNWKGHASLPNQSLESRETKLDGEEKVQFLRLMRKMLEERPSAEELLFDALRG